jgi:hypothetical protein
VSVKVSLSSGDAFYVDAELDEVVNWLFEREGVVAIGRRYINPQQVTQLEAVHREHIPSIYTPESLEADE